MLLSACGSIQITNEDYSGENFYNFEQAPNLVNYLSADPDSVTTLIEDKKELTYSVRLDSKSKIEPEDYVDYLQSSGYQITLLDTTISAAFFLEKESYSISLTAISDIDSYKDAHHELSYINELTDQNILFTIIKE